MIRFYGHSDDCIEIEGDIREEVSGSMGKFLVGSPDNGLVVAIEYVCVWRIGVEQVEDGIPLPSWPIRVTQGPNDYSVALEVDCPPGTLVRRKDIYGWGPLRTRTED